MTSDFLARKGGLTEHDRLRQRATNLDCPIVFVKLIEAHDICGPILLKLWLPAGFFLTMVKSMMDLTKEYWSLWR